MGDLMGSEEFVEAVERRVLERRPRQVDHPRERDALEVGNLRDPEMIPRTLAEQVREPLEAVGDVRRDDLAHVALLRKIEALLLQLLAQEPMRILGDEHVERWCSRMLNALI